MGRLVRDSRLETREARKRLAARKEPHWRSIMNGCHLGYYKGAQGTSWCARIRKDGKYHYETLGIPDDHADANGANILSYAQAQEKAKQFGELLLTSADHQALKAYTVLQATEEYLADFKANGKKSLKNTLAQINAHILPTLGDKLVSALTYNQLNAWKNSLANTPKRLRSSKLTQTEQKYQYNDDNDPEYQRKRRATANRIINILKAILNHAFNTNRVKSDDAWKRLKPFKNVSEPKIRFLTEAEITRLINACAPDFRALVRGALLSGARYGELSRLRTRDFHRESQTIFISESKSGKPRSTPLNAEGVNLFTQLTIGKKPNDLIFVREDGIAWGRSYQIRPLEAACKNANITPSINFHLLRHAYAGSLAMRAVPLQVIASALGHSDTRITHKHYAHLMPSYVADVIKANLPEFGKTEKNNLHNIKLKNEISHA